MSHCPPVAPLVSDNRNSVLWPDSASVEERLTATVVSDNRNSVLWPDGTYRPSS